MLQVKSKLQSGFTIIELLIVIAIIGILATLVLTNFQGAQARGRDTVRTNDINSVYSKLEERYNDEGFYLSEEITAANVTTLFPGIDAEAVTDEEGDVITTTFTDGLTAPAPEANGDNTDGTNQYILSLYGEGCASGSECDKYVLSAYQETNDAGPGNNYVKQSLN